MQEFLQYLGVVSLSTGLAYTVIVFFSKRIFENYLQRGIEKYKSDLERTNIGFQIQFASLHKERAEVIKRLYQALYAYKIAVLDFFEGDLNKDQPVKHFELKIQAWTNAVLNFSPLFHVNRIFFSEKLCSLIDSINNEMDKINNDTKDYFGTFQLAIEQIEAIRSSNPKYLELKNRSNKLLNEKIFPLEQELENEFRKILGVEIK